ncbi:MAG: hypothetical protein ACI9KE_004888 [Polyangiales bacterium]|jgi:hypothetical protein
MSRRVIIACVSVFMLGASAGAQPSCEVEPTLVAARQALENAEFETADVLLDRVSQCPLNVEMLRAMLELQVLVGFADQRLGALERHLRSLVSLDPSAEAPQIFPRAVVARWEELQRSTPQLEASAEVVSEYEEGVHAVGIVAQRQNDPGNLVLRIDVFARLSGQERYRLLGNGQRLEISEPHEPASIDVYLALYGPGGAQVGSRGSPEAPLQLPVEPIPVNRRPLRIGLAVGMVLFAVAAAVFVVAAVRTDGFRGGETTVNSATRGLSWQL